MGLIAGVQGLTHWLSIAKGLAGIWLGQTWALSAQNRAESFLAFIACFAVPYSGKSQFPGQSVGDLLLTELN
jgi:hypothetical protein